MQAEWQDVWDSEKAQAIRASILDGSYRYCNKVACPRFHTDSFEPADKLAQESEFWHDILQHQATAVPQGPELVNLSYDQTCNLSCPSCRTHKIAADEKMRGRYERMQERAILPMLRNAKTVIVTGSGDPFASKNFRRLIQQLNAEDYPDLRFQVMTNGMLFTPSQWAAFPSLHGRVEKLRISLDAGTGPTHELLRRGARWETMLENMAFAKSLHEQGLIGSIVLAYVVQVENYAEMGVACDLAASLNVDSIAFGRMTNWGTFSDQEYRRKAVFLPGHPEHAAFCATMQDPRLRDPRVFLGDLSGFFEADTARPSPPELPER